MLLSVTIRVTLRSLRVLGTNDGDVIYRRDANPYKKRKGLGEVGISVPSNIIYHEISVKFYYLVGVEFVH